MVGQLFDLKIADIRLFEINIRSATGTLTSIISKTVLKHHVEIYLLVSSHPDEQKEMQQAYV